ncbi:copper chaperone [Rhodococcoides trifolii]|uniref:Copper chaperone n=1 Tax=Rhodococcoides trifolii TaxID=908250 RepID=A0A917LIT5_9NOCA|nr:heavy-metal-associated domain-containing protein [Rhodococcus trifolii]GGG27641.1 copper chaperone [Rhodococcus trifolii]
MFTTEYRITGMTCSHCASSISTEVHALPGVDGVDVSAESGVLLVRSSSELDDARVIDAVHQAGYGAERS